MSDIIKYAALGVVGFVAYEYFLKPAMYPAIPTPLASNVAPANGSNITTVNIGILQKLFNKVGGNVQTFTYDQWNYYYNQITGTYAKSWENTVLNTNGQPREKTMTAQDFLTVNAIDAMSGLSGMHFSFL